MTCEPAVHSCTLQHAAERVPPSFQCHELTPTDRLAYNCFDGPSIFSSFSVSSRKAHSVLKSLSKRLSFPTSHLVGDSSPTGYFASRIWGHHPGTPSMGVGACLLRSVVEVKFGRGPVAVGSCFSAAVHATCDSPCAVAVATARYHKRAPTSTL